MPNLNERLHRPPSSVHHRAEQGEAAREKVKSDSTKCSYVCSHLPLSRSPSLFITPFLRSRSHSVFLWNRPSVMSTEISRHSAGASAGLTFLLPVIYIREGAHGGFSMPAKEGAATALLASTQGLDAVRDSNNGGTDHQAQRCLHSEKEPA